MFLTISYTWIDLQGIAWSTWDSHFGCYRYSDTFRQGLQSRQTPSFHQQMGLFSYIFMGYILRIMCWCTRATSHVVAQARAEDVAEQWMLHAPVTHCTMCWRHTKTCHKSKIPYVGLADPGERIGSGGGLFPQLFWPDLSVPPFPFPETSHPCLHSILPATSAPVGKELSSCIGQQSWSSAGRSVQVFLLALLTCRLSQTFVHKHTAHLRQLAQWLLHQH